MRSAKTLCRVRTGDAGWLAGIPCHWDVKPLKRVVSVRGGLTPDKSNPAFWDGDIPWITAKDMKSQRLSDAEDHVSADALRSTGLRFIEPPAVLVVVRGMILAHTLPAAEIDSTVTINQDMKALRPGPDLTPAFLAWMLRGASRYVLSLAEESAHGTKALRTDRLFEMPVPLPPLDEQEGIAAYLDRETARIDVLVAAKQRLIELLQEKRNAVIARAVTRGLDGSAATKEYSAASLGTVPAHWSVLPLRRIVEARGGLTPDKSNTSYWDGMVPWVTPKDMKLQRLADSEDHTTDIALRETALRVIAPPAVLIVVRGMILAHTLPVAEIDAAVTINQDLKALTTRPGVDVDTSYMAWLLRGLSTFLLSCADESAHGTKALRTEILFNVPLPVPPLGEQQAIVSYLEDAVNQMDATKTNVEAALARLTEYRAALITSAVTGRIDVRAIA